MKLCRQAYLETTTNYPWENSNDTNLKWSEREGERKKILKIKRYFTKKVHEIAINVQESGIRANFSKTQQFRVNKGFWLKF